MKTGKWTEEEKQLLLDNSNSMSIKELSELLDRSVGSIRGKKQQLGLNNFRIPWTEDEKRIIINYFLDHHDTSIDMDYLCSLTGRSKAAIHSFAFKNGLTNKHRSLSEEANRKRVDSIKNNFYTTEYYQNIWLPKQKEILLSYAGKTSGFSGKHHTEETKEKMSISHIEFFDNMTDLEKQEWGKKKNGSRYRAYIREDLNKYFRSSWEANFARILNHLDIEWVYEPKRYYFKNKINKVSSYLPDFYLPQFDIWIEIKGWMNEKSRIKLELFEEEYPEEYKKLILIEKDQYEFLEKKYSWLKNWETNGTRGKRNKELTNN